MTEKKYDYVVVATASWVRDPMIEVIWTPQGVLPNEQCV